MIRDTKDFKSIYFTFNAAVAIGFGALVMTAWPYKEQGYSQSEIDGVGDLAMGEVPHTRLDMGSSPASPAKPVTLYTAKQIGDARIFKALMESRQ